MSRYPRYFKPFEIGSGMERTYVFQKWFSPTLLSRTTITLAELPLVGVRMESQTDMLSCVMLAETQISLQVVKPCTELQYQQELSRVMGMAKDAIRTITGAEEAEVLP